MSAAKLLPAPSRESDVRAIARRTVLDRSLEERVDDLVRGGYLAHDGGAQLWRISVRMFALRESDYGQSLEELRRAVDSALAKSKLADNGQVTATYTGLLPLIVESRRQLLSDLVSSFGSALVIISLVLAIAFRSVGFGLLALLPNVFPTLLVFGYLGWIGSHIDVGSMMTASIGLGIAVDDTVHYLTWFHRGVAEGKSPIEAIQMAYERCGAAMVRTTLIVSAGLFMFFFSPLLPGGAVCADDLRIAVDGPGGRSGVPARVALHAGRPSEALGTVDYSLTPSSLPHRAHQHALDLRRDVRRSFARFIAALAIGDLGANVTGTVFAVGRHGHEQVGPQLLRRQLILHEQFARHEQHRASLSDRHPISTVSPALQRRSQMRSCAA